MKFSKTLNENDIFYIDAGKRKNRKRFLALSNLAKLWT